MPLVGQENSFFHPELDWFTIETEHFLVHYHNGSERTAKEVARIAEQVYHPITQLYQHNPDQKVSFVIRDHDDYSNGAAYFYDNKIEIWAPSLDFELRGTHPWLLNVVTHEFTHIVQIQTTMKLGRKFPGVYFQWLGYESERRPDVLYGYPNVIASYPISAFVVPGWFAEGVAQYSLPEKQYDYWDSHRDMILRMYMLDGNPLSWEEMAVFGKTSLGNESSYNAGFSVVQFIAENYGPDKLRIISERLSSLPRITIDGAIEDAVGKSGEALYEEWKRAKSFQYRSYVAEVLAHNIEGDVIETEGFGNFYPQFSPDGSKLAYVSNKGNDYFSPSTVYIYDLQTKAKKSIVGSVRSTLSFSPDGRFLYYAKSSRKNPHWSRFYDLYRYDIAEEEETRMTNGWRAQNPKISADASRIVFAFGGDGTMNIGVADADGKNLRKLTRFEDGEQVYTPCFAPDNKTVVFGYSKGHNQSLAEIQEDGTGYKTIAMKGDCRNPAFSPDGKSLYYTSDRTGIFNIYRRDLDSGKETQVTNVLGGAFVPAISVKNELAYATYTSSGYKIAFLRNPGSSQVPQTQIAAKELLLEGSKTGVSHGEPYEQQELTARIATQDVSKELAAPRPYRNIFTSLTIIPFVRFDNYNQRNSGVDMVKPGLYFTSGDVLEKLSLFGGAALNRKLERDLFLIFQYNDRLPILYQLGWEPSLQLELYNLTRKTGNSFELPPYTGLIGIEVTYNLFEFDASLTQKLFSENNNLRLTYTLSRYSADIGAFVNPNDGRVNPAFSNAYLVGNAFSATLKHDGLKPSTDREINPTGRSVFLRYSYELNKFNPNGDFDVVNSVLVPVYTNFNFQRIEGSWTEHVEFPFPKHTVTLSLHGGSIMGPSVDNFFDLYAGGFAGMRGYPFYALGGNTLARAQLAYRFPISTSLDFRFLQFYFKKLYFSFFGDYGNAWTGTAPAQPEWKKDAGFELRLEAFSFYAYPTRIFFSGAYGFDRFTKKFSGVDVTYGEEWRFYLGVLFGFDLNELVKRER